MAAVGIAEVKVADNVNCFEGLQCQETCYCLISCCQKDAPDTSSDTQGAGANDHSVAKPTAINRIDHMSGDHAVGFNQH